MAIRFDQTRTQLLIDSLQPDRLTRIVDIGANPLVSEECPYKDLLDMGGCEVFGFEPQQEAFDKLQADKGPNEHYFQEVVGDGGKAELKVTIGPGCASLLEPNEVFQNFSGVLRRLMRVIDRVPVQTKRLDDMVDLPEFDLMKIDIQGGETAVFQNSQVKLAKAIAVISEVAAIPLYKDQPLLDAQMAELRAQGFQLHKFLFFKAVMLANKVSQPFPRKACRSQLSDGDAVFVRALLDLDTLTDEQLKHLAILADAVFLSADLAALALDKLLDRGVAKKEPVETYVQSILANAA